MKVNVGTYEDNIICNFNRENNYSHSVFELTSVKLQKNFSRKFAKLIPNLNQDQKTSECYLFQMILGSMEFKKAHSLELNTSLKTIKEH